VVGEFRDGRWTQLERLPVDPGSPSIDLDEDRATGLILVCEAGSEPRWADRLTQAMLEPQRLQGY
jgi:hypothetical protein